MPDLNSRVLGVAGSCGHGSRVGRHGLARRVLGALGLAAALLAGAATTSREVRAEDASATMRDLAEASDFRVRVSAALLLGHTRPVGALAALQDALEDGHPAVRVAAARALGSLGDASALPALERRAAHDPSASVTAQVRVSIAQLRHVGSGDDAASADPPGASSSSSSSSSGGRHLGPGVRYVVELGAMRNQSALSGERGEELRRVLGDAAHARARAMRGAAVSDADATVTALRQQAAARHLPIITLDGNVTQVTESHVGGGLEVQVRVEFAVRRGQTLKGTVSGAATTFGSGNDVSEASRRKLEDDAVAGAVQSALRGAEDGLLVAAR